MKAHFFIGVFFLLLGTYGCDNESKTLRHVGDLDQIVEQFTESLDYCIRLNFVLDSLSKKMLKERDSDKLRKDLFAYVAAGVNRQAAVRKLGQHKNEMADRMIVIFNEVSIRNGLISDEALRKETLAATNHAEQVLTVSLKALDKLIVEVEEFSKLE